MDSDRSGDEGFKGRFSGVSGVSGGGGKSGIPGFHVVTLPHRGGSESDG